MRVSGCAGQQLKMRLLNASQAAYEKGWQETLIESIDARTNAMPSRRDKRPSVQAVFCIDVRSEVFRRALEAASPAFRHTVGRSARHAAEAMELLREVAEADFAAVGHPPVIERLQVLSPARQANVLRHWLRREHATTPSTAQLTQLQRQIAACTTRGHGLHLLVGVGEVRRDGEHLAWRRRS